MKTWQPSLYIESFKQIGTLQFILNADSLIVEANESACKAFGLCFAKQEVIAFSEIAGFIYPENIAQNIAESWQKGSHIFELEYKQNFKIVPYEVYTKSISINNEKYLICSAHTIFNSREVENKILSAVIETEEKERSRFAKDLHDGLGPLLSTIKLYVHELSSDDIKSQEQQEYIQYIIELLDEAVTNTRDISNNLTPQIISSYGLVKSIESFINKINITQKLNISFLCKDVPDNLPKTIELTLFRIVIELINNTIKHAYADQIVLSLFTKDARLFLEYKDDGIGFDLEKALKKGSSGIGLTNIINRIKSMSGDFSFNDQLEKGAEIKFSIAINT